MKLQIAKYKRFQHNVIVDTKQ